MALILQLFIAISISTGFTIAFYKYESSYAFMNVKDNAAAPETRICVNFQHWRKRGLPASAEEATALRLGWWNALRNTNICDAQPADPSSFANAIVPANYVTNMSEITNCQGHPGYNGTDMRPIRNEVEVMKLAGVQNIIFLVKKGQPYGNHKNQNLLDVLKMLGKISDNFGLHNYLFTYFYNSEIDDSDASISVFYVYEHTFHQNLASIAANSSELRIYQPQSPFPMDPAVAVLWLFAFVSILIGSLWAAADTRQKLASRLKAEAVHSSQTELTLEEDGQQQQSQANEAFRCQTVNEPNMSNEQQSAEADEPIPKANNVHIKAKNEIKRSESTELAQMNSCQHCFSVFSALCFVVLILMLAYFFRDYVVHIFNFFLVLFGTISLHSCLYTLLRCAIGRRECHLCTPRQLFKCCCPKKSNTATVNDEHLAQSAEGNNSSRDSAVVMDIPSNSSSSTRTEETRSKLSVLDRPIRLISLLIYLFTFGICLCWFFIRNHYNAYLLLDPINICICIYAIRASRIHSLRLITLLLLAMFAYDIFMVFGTRLLTPDGCSVMIQVVTGTDCRPTTGTAGNRDGYQPVAPIELNVPEKLPLLFYMPMLADPMGECFDVEVEREYKHVMLGLGDVILPGYLIAFCFYADVVKRNRWHTYGLISLIGYSLGMVCTFVALMLMETGQPALIYLVPCTLIPVYGWAWLFDSKGTLDKMWHGQL